VTYAGFFNGGEMKLENYSYHSCKTRLGIKNKEGAFLGLTDMKRKIDL